MAMQSVPWSALNMTPQFKGTPGTLAITSVLTFVSEQVVPDGYISKVFKLGVCIPG